MKRIAHRWLILATAGVLAAASACSAQQPSAPTTTSSTGAVLSLHDYASALADCARRAGVIVTMQGPAYEFNPGSGMDGDAVSAIVAQCRDRLGPMPTPPTDPVTAGQVYDRYVAAAACLRKLGWDIPPAPSRQSFVDHYGKGTGPNWDPYATLLPGVNVTQDEYTALTGRCPDWETS